MKNLGIAALSLALGAVLIGIPAAAQAPLGTFVNFEGAQTNPIRISSDGTRLYALNTPGASLSVFDLTNPSSPVLIAEIPVGIEPVSVNPQTNDEVWVVNQVSGSVSIVSVSKGIVTDTLYAKDEPSDVVFAGSNLAFVSVRGGNLVNVYSTQTPHPLVKSIPLVGDTPRALATSRDGSWVYVAFALSGNHTTLVPSTVAPAQPPPVNTQLPAPPQVGLIVDASNPAWSKVIQYTVPDNDVAVINTTNLSVANYYRHVGTINLGLAVQPQTGNIYVANTDALNTVHFACANPGCPTPNLTGHWVNNRVTPITVATNTVGTPIDLNPGIDYTILPNPAALVIALAQPTAVLFEPTGRYLYIAAFGTDRVAVLDTTTGTITARIEIGQTPGSIVNSQVKRGPRGLALNAAAHRLYVLNRIYNTVSVVDTSQNAVIKEIPTGSFDPTPTVIRQGRGFLYDAKLSGNGTGACASCHVDAEIDMLAWDLGDPTGSMETVVNGGNTFQMHPMKGPMTTQSLRGLNGMQPYHWRGDKADFSAFNEAFSSLMGGPQLSSADMTAYTNFINTIVYPPNPNQNLDRTLPASVALPYYVNGATGNPSNGQTYFENGVAGITICNSCHTYPGPGTNLIIDSTNVGNGTPLIQPLKVPQLRNQYQRVAFNNVANAISIDGFGLLHDGAFTAMDVLAAVAHKATLAEREDLYAFQLCFDTGMAPAVGFTITLSTGNVTGSNAQSGWNLLETQALVGNIDLIANGTLNGQRRGLLYHPAANNYQTDTAGLGPFTRAQLTTMLQAGDTLSFMGVPPGTGLQMEIDRPSLYRRSR